MAAKAIKLQALARKAAKAKRVKWLQPLIARHTPVSDWLLKYGTDPVYGSKRSRRIMDKGFQKLLRSRYSPLLSRFGTVYVDSYPPPTTAEDLMLEQQQQQQQQQEQLQQQKKQEIKKAQQKPDDNQQQTVDEITAATTAASAPLTIKSDFILVYFPTFRPERIHRKTTIEFIKQNPHTAYLHLPTAIRGKESIVAVVVRIQCAARQKHARKLYRK
jgi:hypothetical protein